MDHYQWTENKLCYPVDSIILTLINWLAQLTPCQAYCTIGLGMPDKICLINRIMQPCKCITWTKLKGDVERELNFCFPMANW